jgi:hypothetical protein
VRACFPGSMHGGWPRVEEDPLRFADNSSRVGVAVTLERNEALDHSRWHSYRSAALAPGLPTERAPVSPPGRHDDSTSRNVHHLVTKGDAGAGVAPSSRVRDGSQCPTFIWSSPDRQDLIAASSCSLHTLEGNEPFPTTCGNKIGQSCMPSRRTPIRPSAVQERRVLRGRM